MSVYRQYIPLPVWLESEFGVSNPLSLLLEEMHVYNQIDKCRSNFYIFQNNFPWGITDWGAIHVHSCLGQVCITNESVYAEGGHSP